MHNVAIASPLTLPMDMYGMNSTMALVIQQPTKTATTTTTTPTATNISAIRGAGAEVQKMSIDSVSSKSLDLAGVSSSSSSSSSSDGGEALKTTATTTTIKKRPIDIAAIEATSSSSSSKRPRHDKTEKKAKKSVRFQPAIDNESGSDSVRVERRTFDIDYENSDVWWTKEENQIQMQRQSSLLTFYADACPDYADSALLVWVHCAEEALDDGNYCMTMEERHAVALKVAESPVRGFEKELAASLITEQRIKTIGGLLELQLMCQNGNSNGDVSPEEQQEALAAASEAFSHTATLFAKTIAIADAQVAKEHCTST